MRPAPEPPAVRRNPAGDVAGDLPDLDWRKRAASGSVRAAKAAEILRNTYPNTLKPKNRTPPTPKRRLALSPFPPVVLIEALQPLLGRLLNPFKLPHDLSDALPGETVLGSDVGLGGPEGAPGGNPDVPRPEIPRVAVPALYGAAGLRRRGSVEPPGPTTIAGSGSARTTQRGGMRLLPDQTLHNVGAPIVGYFVGRCRGPEGGGEAAALPYRCATSG